MGTVTGGRPEVARAVGALGGWLAGLGDASAVVQRDLAECVAGLDRPGDAGVELVRRWLAVDWVLRAATPRWLRAVGLREQAAVLGRLDAVGSPAALQAAGPVAQTAAEAAGRVQETAWQALVEAVHPDHRDARASEVWAAVVDGARLAGRSICMVVAPAAAATGYPAQRDRGPAAWRDAVAAIGDAAGALVWSATTAMVSPAGWSWDTPAPAARAMAYATGRGALAPIEAASQGTACELLGAMLTHTHPRPRHGGHTA